MARTSDDTRTAADVRHHFGGTGLAVTRMCSVCNKPKSQLGGRIIKKGGLRGYACKSCRAPYDERDAAKKAAASA